MTEQNLPFPASGNFRQKINAELFLVKREFAVSRKRESYGKNTADAVLTNHSSIREGEYQKGAAEILL